MHTVLSLISLLLVVGNTLVLRYTLKHAQSWLQRQWLQLSILLLPFLLLAIGVSGLHHILGAWCMLPTWDVLLGIDLPLLVAGVGCAAMGRRAIHLLRIRKQATQVGSPAPPVLQQYLHRLAKQRGIACPRLLLCMLSFPVALTYGVTRPVILLSTWMIEYLDPQEIEGVLAHELEHVVRHDYLILFLATLLRDAFFFLPWQKTMYWQMHQEKELACDEGAAFTTRRPLALASALLKVNLYALEQASQGKCLETLPSFADEQTIIEQRIARLRHWKKQLGAQDGLAQAFQERHLNLRWRVSFVIFFALLGTSLCVLVFYSVQCALML
ncbi:M56 family metallopeptidase [Ktedonospora formicarum]|uniref:Peptidase M56 domain-containing protein n=1 Tax=Ktedonospora formicarum TaxID=2778364 RepID=A0A8J3HY22_9CHLR|nr:M56 family metallopeptidase [Ktedonospora formicarum]GHO42079.1 hypothetical protein KSX_02420 [Ktedonospora formicarum]